MGTVTDLDGKFTINAKPGQTLEISYIGYSNKTAKVPANGKISIVMTEDTHSLNEVVVVGYGTMKRSDLTGLYPALMKRLLNKVLIPVWSKPCRDVLPVLR